MNVTVLHYMSLAGLAAATLALNLPFGFLRSKVDKFSVRWFLYIHLPIPFIYALRRLLMFRIYVIPLLVVAAVLGQVWGGKIRINRCDLSNGQK